MPMPTPWEADYAVGDPLIDAQHKALLTQCTLLADRCPPAADDSGEPADAGDPVFDRAFEQLKLLAREHFETEASRLAPLGDEALEDHRFECDEFEYLVDQIATTENFSRLEIQRFVAMWCIGHVRGAAEQHRALAIALAYDKTADDHG
jgi:hemerythrin